MPSTPTRSISPKLWSQALADIAAIGILQQRQIANAELRAEQLQHALDSRIAIEQAKGIVSAQRDMSIDEAFDLIRRHARNNNRKIYDVARVIVDHGPDTIGV